MKKNFKRKCPKCGAHIEYKTKYTLKNAQTNNSLCKSCVSSNRPRSKEWCDNISKALVNKPKSKKHIQASKSTLKLKYKSGELVSWNKGLTKKTDNRIMSASLKISDTLKGKILSEETKQKMAKSQKKRWFDMTDFERAEIGRKISEAQSGRLSWNFGKRQSKQTIERRKKSFFDSVLSDLYDTYDDWVNSFTDKEIYYKKVRGETEKQPLHLLENYENRGRNGDGVYHVDHIIPISYGFANGIPPEIIADINNLQMLPYAENIKKGCKTQTNTHQTQSDAK